MKTYNATKENVIRDWHLINADGKVLGRMASEIASMLRGKTKPIYTPYMDAGYFVVVVNAGKILLTGKKLTDKVYHRYSGYPGGLRETTAGELLKKSPEKLLYFAVRGMLPKNSLGRQMLTKLKIYSGNDHPHTAQCPKNLEI